MRFAPLLILVALAGCGVSPTEEPEVPQATAEPVAPPPPPAAPAGAVPLDATLTQASSADAPATTEPTIDPTPPPADAWTSQTPNGQWVYANGYGWMWVSNNANTVIQEETPYVYLYTPAYGWNWYVSPWGYGPYHYGVWVRRPWHPAGWRYGWVARPGVAVHLRAYGGGGYYGRGGGYHGGGRRGGGGRRR